MSLTLNYGEGAGITSLVVNGQKVVSSAGGIFTSVTVGGITYSSLHLTKKPAFSKIGNVYRLSNISYGDKSLIVKENWIFKIANGAIKWTIERITDKPVIAAGEATPVFNFDSINTWEGAYQGYGGLAWFYLFNEKLCTYGVHTRSSDFWNSKNDNGLNITVDAPGKNVAMKYTRTNDDKLAYTISVSDKELLLKYEAGTNRRRFIRGKTDVWAAFNMRAGLSKQSITFTPFDFSKKYGRGIFKGIDGDKVGAVLNTIARIGVIDSLHFGGNSWHTPYGPICLHEQYIAQLGLGINDPKFLMGDQSSLDYYRDHAVKPDGRVYSRWAYTNEDAGPGQFNSDGFYEAQWGTLMDSNPDFVTNIAELYDLTGDKAWVKTHQLSCEKVLQWILNRDSNNNGLVEMMNDNSSQKKSSDWIDIVWASYENAFVNANLYHALVKWADIERQLNNQSKAKYYADFAEKLKASFNRPTNEGGFWDEEKGCYDYWRDKDGSMHGRNMVTPVNFMAIAYRICDNDTRRKTILDNIEAQMVKENLFFWPLAMSTYAPGEASRQQYPFPAYENGDLFLSWGSVAVKAYAEYDPALALKYVRNVLNQYSKDGLAFQRYGRLKQDGLGDDILSGNSLAIVGLYQAVYGINPLYNRFYLDPHITPELAGTVLTYNFRNEKLTISLDNNSYSVANKIFKVTANKSFGFNASKTELSYFNGKSADVSLRARTVSSLAIDVQNWDTDHMEWRQHVTKPVIYTVCQLEPNATYRLSVNGSKAQDVKSNFKGELIINYTPKSTDETILIIK
ncbi:hypothetical protein [Mucilaginibacter sp. UR6-11]|uniref:alpha-L-rhamnosidase-related protein n=1 Tax=Mucilaginibacter sp. UR6-11 TaxID=1435644 RepID=UPI001E386449|nr:hypothetical protein [Mucilaginibacter sp. UR6-11]MCC8426522.1 hypothetical protein [Mucilaginibacter sp. UR6-11]